MMLRDEHGRVADDPLFGLRQPRNINEQQFDTVLEFLVAHDAPVDVREALAGLRLRWETGRRINNERLLELRRLRSMVV